MRKIGLYRTGFVLIFQVMVIMACASGMTDESFGTRNRIFTQTGQILDDRLAEISGMAASGRFDRQFWVLNDSGNLPELYLIDMEGRINGVVRIENAFNTDWEDLVSFTIAETSYLMIADTGDNMARRSLSQLIVIPEPARPLPESVTPSAVLAFQFEDGPRDCESVAVDAPAGKILLLSKRDQPPRLYELPLHTTGSVRTETARRIGTVPSLPVRQARYPYGATGGYNTAMDISLSGTRMVVLTYRELFIFQRQANESWPSAMNRPFISVPLPELNQPEAVCFSANASAVYLTSEKIPAPILTVDLNDSRLGRKLEDRKGTK